jgi:dTDP-4-dehydrorhamnose 3,5-epimerase
MPIRDSRIYTRYEQLMKFNETKIEGLYVAELEPFSDDRGFFTRSYCDKALREIGIVKKIKQINHSLTSTVGAIRGIHYQNPPHAEIKMVRCIAGEIFDVAIDLRRGSDTFLQWHGEYVSAENFKMMIIPEGFAHGFQVIKQNTELLYLHTESYTPKAESGLLFNDEEIGIEWPLQVTDISDRDLKHKIITKEFKGVNI